MRRTAPSNLRGPGSKLTAIRLVRWRVADRVQPPVRGRLLRSLRACLGRSPAHPHPRTSTDAIICGATRADCIWATIPSARRTRRPPCSSSCLVRRDSRVVQTIPGHCGRMSFRAVSSSHGRRRDDLLRVSTRALLGQRQRPCGPRCTPSRSKESTRMAPLVEYRSPAASCAETEVSVLRAMGFLGPLSVYGMR